MKQPRRVVEKISQFSVTACILIVVQGSHLPKKACYRQSAHKSYVKQLNRRLNAQ